MTQLKFRVSGYSWRFEIDVLEITRESDHSIWFKRENGEYMERKNTSENKHFDSWEDAHSYLLGRVQRKYENAVSELYSATKSLELVKEMTCPKPNIKA